MNDSTSNEFSFCTTLIVYLKKIMQIIRPGTRGHCREDKGQYNRWSLLRSSYMEVSVERV
jgi:hypothetical protein